MPPAWPATPLTRSSAWSVAWSGVWWLVVGRRPWRRDGRVVIGWGRRAAAAGVLGRRGRASGPGLFVARRGWRAWPCAGFGDTVPQVAEHACRLAGVGGVASRSGQLVAQSGWRAWPCAGFGDTVPVGSPASGWAGWTARGLVVVAPTGRAGRLVALGSAVGWASRATGGGGAPLVISVRCPVCGRARGPVAGCWWATWRRPSGRWRGASRPPGPVSGPCDRFWGVGRSLGRLRGCERGVSTVVHWCGSW